MSGERIKDTELTYSEDSVEELYSPESGRKIVDLEDAARYAYAISEIRKEIGELNAIADKEVAKWQEKIGEVEHWRESVIKPLQERLDYFTRLLTFFHEETFNNADEKAQKRLKSIKLPYGITLTSRELPVALEVEDEDKLLAYAKKIGQVKVTEKPDWAEIKKSLHVDTNSLSVVNEDGEIIDFIKAYPQGRKFEVK